MDVAEAWLSPFGNRALDYTAEGPNARKRRASSQLWRSISRASSPRSARDRQGEQQGSARQRCGLVRPRAGKNYQGSKVLEWADEGECGREFDGVRGRLSDHGEDTSQSPRMTSGAIASRMARRRERTISHADHGSEEPGSWDPRLPLQLQQSSASSQTSTQASGRGETAISQTIQNQRRQR